MRKSPLIVLVVALGTLTCACGGSDASAGADNGNEQDVTSGGSFTARGTGYYPDSSALEGGFTDRKGAKLNTLQGYLSKKAPFVSVAMDTSAFPYGTRLSIKELNAKYGGDIPFRFGHMRGAVRRQGHRRLDI